MDVIEIKFRKLAQINFLIPITAVMCLSAAKETS